MSNVVDEALLVYVESGANSNKFYRLRLHADGSVHKLWGRVRDGAGLTGQTQVEQGGRSRFDKIFADKTKKGYTRVQVADTTGTNSAAATQTQLRDTAAASLAGGSTDKVVTTLVDRLVAANKHNLMASTGGMISVDTSGQARTALGVITPTAVADARVLLARIAREPEGPGRAPLTEQYLRLVPHAIPVSEGRGWAAGWLTRSTSLEQQQELLDALESSASYADAARRAAVAAETGDTSVDEDFFRYRVHRLEEGTDEYEMVVGRFHTTKQSVHRDVSTYAPKYVYRLEDRRHGAEVDAARARVRNVQKLWHGTGAANVLSILQKGLYVPPTRGTSIHIAGRMFGDGVYLSRSASKSLRYSAGLWGGGRSASTFMFLTETAMGYEYRPKGNIGYGYRRPLADENGKAFNSTNALPELVSGLRNHEAIVEDPMQVSLSWLVEF
ncbi:WGR domain-containing protein [uncultured Microbacterium sp.]|uniref:WGR domain-containing protein n=1 Tax=uncultured Microbacterium sp. TaxID=191216 RepID=UPI0026272623|nr:WGR domain-containing protein [uncultured Microbacterium sp.]